MSFIFFQFRAKEGVSQLHSHSLLARRLFIIMDWMGGGENTSVISKLWVSQLPGMVWAALLGSILCELSLEMGLFLEYWPMPNMSNPYPSRKHMVFCLVQNFFSCSASLLLLQINEPWIPQENIFTPCGHNSVHLWDLRINCNMAFGSTDVQRFLNM